MQFGSHNDNLLTLARNAMSTSRLLKSISDKLYLMKSNEVGGDPQWPLLLMIVVFAAIILIVNPVREMLTADDGWAYARIVEHLLHTGEYRLDAWAAANMPAQIYLAAGLARIFGFSLSLLRISTILVFLLGALAFYQLLHESGSDRTAAAALTLALMCSPFVLLLSFTFMTDVQFLGWLLIACWLYARGLRRGNAWTLFLGGSAATSAILTRQFGIALTAGLIFSWILSHREKRVRVRSILAGAGPPCVAFLWQLWTVREHQTFTQSVRLIEESRFLHQTVPALLLQLVWRCAVITQYAGLYLCAILPGLLLLIYKSRKMSIVSAESKHARPLYSRLGIFLWLAFLIVGQITNTSLAKSAFPDYFRAALIPTIPWLVGVTMPNSTRYRLALTVLGLASTVLLGAFLSQAFDYKATWRRRDPTNLFFIGTASAFIVLHLFYVQLNDTYVIVFLPFVLIALAQLLKTTSVATASVWTIAACSATLGIAVAVCLRGTFNHQEAVWHACNQVRAAGIETEQICPSCYPWPEYYSAFDEWLTHLGPLARPQDFSGRFHDSYRSWTADKERTAKYVILSSDAFPRIEGYIVVGYLQYRDILLNRRFVYVLEQRSVDYSRENPTAYKGDPW
jgi:4-amino-4-deoxy-L-arabinose transferase-like glycosyltransferase